MSNKLPNVIDPVYCAQHEKQYVVSVSQGLFPRLEALVISTENDVEVRVSFYRHKQLRSPALDMELKTTLVLQCQRSLQKFKHELELSLTVVFVESLELAKDFPKEVEIYELVEEKIPLLDLVEDELLLGIPLSPVDSSRVMEYENKEFEEQSSEQEVAQKENPFEALRALQKNK